MTDPPKTQATEGVPTYLGKGDPEGKFADYYPAWVDKLASDVTLEGSMLDGAVQGADAIRAIIGQTQHIAAHYRPLSSLLFFSRLLGEGLAGTPYAEHFLAGEA